MYSFYFEVEGGGGGGGVCSWFSGRQAVQMDGKDF